MIFAHSRNAEGVRQELGEHLRAVAEGAAAFAAPFGGAELARAAGRWHDVGKADPAFQAYLEACERDPVHRHTSVDHKCAGALIASERAEPLAFLIQGHHGGLPDLAELKTILRDRADRPGVRAARERALTLGLVRPGEPDRAALAFPTFAQEPLGLELYLRMLFSALVDADHLDTERHFSPERHDERSGAPELAELAGRLEAAQAALSGRNDDPVNRIRHEVYQACRAAAPLPPGFFRLTVPTGGGKTRSGLAFALEHALAHGLRRVVVAVPYLAITEQTVDVYRQVLGDDRAVLEHHSGAGTNDDAAGQATPAAIWRRLAAQNWDAPLIVTTTVQLFESLLGRSPSACRKLHRLARAVIILDEAQTLPPPLLAPILSVLKELVANYGTSVVLCTATQPAFDATSAFAGLPRFCEIAPDPPRLFRTLRRVRYEWPAATERWAWARVAEEMRSSAQALAVVNTKADALALLAALDDADALHLSTLLCGAHRRDVLRVIRDRLRRGLPCRVVSTQVVEAGVDLDFPLVLRAMGPLDRIVQAAGRCNREGRLSAGRVVVFQPEEGGLPSGPYKTATDTTAMLLNRGALDVDDPATFPDYFRLVFDAVDLDAQCIQALRAGFEYEKVASRFKLIEDDSVSVVVPYKGLPHDPQGRQHAARVTALLDELRMGARGGKLGEARRVFARVQPYVVAVRRRQLADYAGAGWATELVAGIWEWQGKYDPVLGLAAQGRDAAELVV